METFQHRLAAVWFADIVGFTTQAAADEGKALRVVQSFQEAARDVVRRHGGRIVKFIGDAAMADFPSTESAVRAAAALPDACAAHAVKSGVTCPTLRIAVHVGDVTTAPDGDVYGDGVNTAARIVKAVKPGEVWVSEDVWRQLRNRPRIRLEERPTQELKDVGATRVWAVAQVEGEGAVPVTSLAGRAKALLGEVQRRRSYQLAAALVIALAGALAAWLVLGPGRSADLASLAGFGGGSGALDPARLAVLYFDDRSEGKRLGGLVEGLTEALIHDLAQAESITVISRDEVEPYRDTGTPLDSIARALRAGKVIRGRVEESAERVRVTAELVDATDMTQLVSFMVEKPQGELLDIQDAIVEEVSTRLRQRLGDEIRLQRSREATSSAEAWELVQRVADLRDQARAAPDTTVSHALRREADSLLYRAEALDPNWIEPILWRGQLALDEKTLPALERGLADVTRALALDPRAPGALALRGALQHGLARHQSDSVRAAQFLSRAERDLRGAVAGDPSLASARIELADLLYNSKWDLPRARDEARRAYEADAFLLEEAHFSWLCEISMQLKDFDEALRWCEEGRRRFHRRPQRILLVELTILASEGIEPNPAEAWRLVGEMSRLSNAESNTPAAQMVAAAVLMRAGLADSAQAVARRANAAAPEDDAAYMAYLESYVQLLAGNRPAALRLLRTFLIAAPSYRYQIANDHWYDRLDGDPDFEALVDRRHLPIFCQILCEPPL